MDIYHRSRHSLTISRNPFLLLLSIHFFRYVIAAGPSKCFYHDGTHAADRQPCIPAENRTSDEHSGCCQLGNPVGNNIDICTSEGLCLDQNATDTRRMLYQGSCTDSSLEDRTCRQHCAPDTKGESPLRHCFSTSCKILAQRERKKLTSPRHGCGVLHTRPLPKRSILLQ